MPSYRIRVTRCIQHEVTVVAENEPAAREYAIKGANCSDREDYAEDVRTVLVLSWGRGAGVEERR